MYSITKQFDFCYGHRVHNQKLNKEFALDDRLVCRHIHGHQGQVIVVLESAVLVNDMVTDFKHLNFFKCWLDDTLDHKLVLDIKDPVVRNLFPKIDTLKVSSNDGIFYTIDDLSSIQNEWEKEIYEGLVLVNFNPTSENLCAALFVFLSNKLTQLNVTLKSITFKETPKTSAEYSK